LALTLNTGVGMNISGMANLTGVNTSVILYSDGTAQTSNSVPLDSTLFGKGGVSAIGSLYGIGALSCSYTGKYITGSYYGYQFYVSSNYGASFTTTSITSGWGSSAMSANGQYQLIVSENGSFYTSTAYGVIGSWNSSNLGFGAFYASISANGQYQAVATFGYGVYLSSSYGGTGTWSQVLTSAVSNNRICSISVSSTGQYMLTVCGRPGGTGGFVGNVYVSSSYGALNTWYAIPSLYFGGLTTAMSSTGQYQMITATQYSSTIPIYASTNYGSIDSWYPIMITGPINSYVSMDYTGQYVSCFIGAQGGNLYVSTNYGVSGSWYITSMTGGSLSDNFLTGCLISGNGQYIFGTSNANGRIFYITNPTLVQNVTVNTTGNVTAGTITATNVLSVTNDLTPSGRLFVGGDASLNSRLFVGGDVTLNNRLFVSGDASFNGRFFIGGTLNLGVLNPSGGYVTSNGSTTLFTQYGDGSIATTSQQQIDNSLFGNASTWTLTSTPLSGSPFLQSIGLSYTGQYQIAISNYKLNVSSNYGLSGSWYSPFNDQFTSHSIVSVSLTGQYQTTCTVTYGNIYVSTYYGLTGTWTLGSTNIQNCNTWCPVAISANGQYQVTASNASNNGYSGIYVSTTYGIGNWNKVWPLNYFSAVSISANGQYQTAVTSNNTVSTSNNIVISTNYGVSGSWYYSYPSASWSGVSVSSTGQYQTAIANPGSIYTSTFYGASGSWNAVTTSNAWFNVSISSTGQYQTACLFTGNVFVSSSYGASGSWFQVAGAYGSQSYSWVAISGNANYIIKCSATAILYTSVSPYLIPNISTNTVYSNTGVVTLANDISLNGRLFVGSDVSFNGNAYIYGNVGIGVSAPQAPLDIMAGTNTYTPSSGYYFASSTGSLTSVGTTMSNFSLYARGSILTTGSVVAANSGSFSDSRIKTNMIDLSSVDTLSIIQQLTPVQYQYIDTLTHSSVPTYGFIAQDVEKIIPEAVNQMSGTVPNIYDIADISSNQFTLRNTSTSQFIINESNQQIDSNGIILNPTDICGNSIEITAYDVSNNKITTTLTTIIDSSNFTVSDVLDMSSIFVYGQSVPDFRVVDKDVIYAITTASVQKMNTLLLSLESQVAEQDAEQTELLQSLSQCQQTTQTILSQQEQMNQTLNSQTDQINSILVKLGGTAGTPLPPP